MQSADAPQAQQLLPPSASLHTAHEASSVPLPTRCILLFDIVEVFKVCPRTGVLLGMSAHHARSVLHLLTDCSRLLSSILLLPDLVHRGASLRSSAMVRLLILGALFHPSGLIARGAVGPLSPSLHLSTRLIPVSTGISTSEEHFPSPARSRRRQPSWADGCGVLPSRDPQAQHKDGRPSDKRRF